MKQILVIFSVMMVTFSIQSQSKNIKKNKNAKVAMEVNGVCGMCKKRIESAALKTKGVKFALWNVKTHQLNLIIDERKTNSKTIKENIAKAGHDSEGITASKEAYNSVDPCCKYRDEKIILEHETAKNK